MGGEAASANQPYPGKGNGGGRTHREHQGPEEHDRIYPRAVLDHVLRDGVRISQSPLQSLEELLASHHHFEDNLFLAIEHDLSRSFASLIEAFRERIVSSGVAPSRYRAHINLMTRGVVPGGPRAGYVLQIGSVQAHVQSRIAERLPWFIPRNQLVLRCLPELSLQYSNEFQLLVRDLIRCGIEGKWNMVHYDSTANLVAVHLGDYYVEDRGGS